jgi:hypothetical protein
MKTRFTDQPTDLANPLREMRCTAQRIWAVQDSNL